MKNLILVAMIILCGNTFAQKKIYRWRVPAPVLAIREDISLGDTVAVSILDRSIKPKKITTNTSFRGIKNANVYSLSRSFPNTHFIPTDSIAETDTPVDRELKIYMIAYHAGYGTDISTGITSSLNSVVFASGKWNAITSLKCDILIDGQKVSKDFTNVASKDDIWGRATSKRALEESYNASMNELLMFAEDSFAN